MVLLNLIIPQVAQSVVDLATNMQTYLTSLNSLVQTLSEQFGLEAEALNEAIGSYQDLMTNIAAYLSKALPDLLNFGYAIGSGVISGITALISSVYMLAGRGGWFRRSRRCSTPFCPGGGRTGFSGYADMPTGYL